MNWVLQWIEKDTCRSKPPQEFSSPSGSKSRHFTVGILFPPEDLISELIKLTEDYFL